MRLRLFSLFLVAAGSAAVVGHVGSASAGKQQPSLRLPAALPPNSCPVPSALRDEFRAAAEDTDLPGARYLRLVLDRFGSTDLAFAAYNTGPAAVERDGARPSDETVAYVQNVTSQWRRLVGCT